MSYQSRKQKQPLEIEADLFAAIATMDKLSNYFDKGYVGETIYRRQLKSCINDVYKARIALEDQGFDLKQFIEREALEEKFPAGLNRLDLVDTQDGEDTSMSVQTLKKLPAIATEYVASSIELIDLLKLRSVARVEYIIPLLDDMYEILIDFPTIKEDHWSIVEVESWRKELLGVKPSKNLSEENCEKLEFDASRWLNDFRKRMKEL